MENNLVMKPGDLMKIREAKIIVMVRGKPMRFTPKALPGRHFLALLLKEEKNNTGTITDVKKALADIGLVKVEPNDPQLELVQLRSLKAQIQAVLDTESEGEFLVELVQQLVDRTAPVIDPDPNPLHDAYAKNAAERKEAFAQLEPNAPPLAPTLDYITPDDNDLVQEGDQFKIGDGEWFSFLDSDIGVSTIGATTQHDDAQVRRPLIDLRAGPADPEHPILNTVEEIVFMRELNSFALAMKIPLDGGFQIAVLTSQFVHQEDRRRDGTTPYYEHVKQVLKNLPPDSTMDQQILAVMHDTKEMHPSKITDKVLTLLGFSSKIILEINILSHDKDAENYEKYVERVALYSDPKVVKLADIEANSSDDPTDTQYAKYERALEILAPKMV